ncbi:MAG TPA: hypothetical protein VGF22_05465 [Acidimicrobiales bacterium]|jgi:hypothetical protein
MSVVLAFAAGCVVGAKAGAQDFRDVTQSLNAIRQSEEFHDLLAALRSHAGQTLRHLADVLEQNDRPAALTNDDLVARVRHIVGRA